MEKGRIKLYTCGPTVYHYAHLGNLRAFVFYDVLKRTLIKAGYDVMHVMNITDVGHLTDDADYGQDKLEKGAKREGKSVWEVAEFFTKEFLRDAELLNILPPSHQPRATEFIKEQIEMVKVLESRGYTYLTDRGVVFDTSKFHRYLELSKMPMDKLCEGARVEYDKQKRNPTDFYLWKFSNPDEKRQMEWDSPWGVGFPGWHIECSAMAKAYLGDTIDIHCGGIDHIAVHHTNEIAQSEAANGVQFSRYWMHNNFLTVDAGLKMAKSAENFLRMQTILDKGFHPLSYRYMCLTAHYRGELLFGWHHLHPAQHTLRRLKQFLFGKENLNIYDLSDSEWMRRFQEAMEEDLDTPRALAIMHEMLSLSESSEIKVSHLIKMDDWLGLGFAQDIKKTTYLSENEMRNIFIDGCSLFDLASRRNSSRGEKNWRVSDSIRDQIGKAGYEVEDNPAGMLIKRSF